MGYWGGTGDGLSSSKELIKRAAVVVLLLNKLYCGKAEDCLMCTSENACSGMSACEDVALLGLRLPGVNACGGWDTTSSFLLD